MVKSKTTELTENQRKVITTEPTPMKAGTPEVLIHGHPVKVDFRIISEELYQKLLKALK